MNENKSNIPLIIDFIDPYALLIVNNNVIGFERSGWTAQTLDSTFSFLSDLCMYPTVAEFIPETFRKYFVVDEAKIMKKENFRLSGLELDGSCIHCIILDKIRMKEDGTIDLGNIRFTYSLNPKNLQYSKDFGKIILAIESAFKIFSNICVASAVDYWERNSDEVDPVVTKDRLEVLSRKDDVPPKIASATNFVIDYLTYLGNEIIQGSISVKDILHFGGLTTISLLAQNKAIHKEILELLNQFAESYTMKPISEQILYFLLIKFCLDSEIREDILNYINKNDKMMNELENGLHRNFPD